MMQMFRAECSECKWVFDVVTLPMPIETAAIAMAKAACPICGNRTDNLCAEPRALTDQERKAKANVLNGGAS